MKTLRHVSTTALGCAVLAAAFALVMGIDWDTITRLTGGALVIGAFLALWAWAQGA